MDGWVHGWIDGKGGLHEHTNHFFFCCNNRNYFKLLDLSCSRVGFPFCVIGFESIVLSFDLGASSMGVRVAFLACLHLFNAAHGSLGRSASLYSELHIILPEG